MKTLFRISVLSGLLAMLLPIKISAQPYAFSQLHPFGGWAGAPDGYYARSAVLAGSDGRLYGTTRAGGIHGDGVVYSMKKDGSDYILLHHFGVAGTDGRSPRGVIEGSDGMLYGATAGGGSAGKGTVFRLSKDGADYSVLHGFAGDADGDDPEARLLEGSDGALYGTTYHGGVYQGSSGGGDYGTVFKLQKDGSGYSVLYAFGGGADGKDPNCTLIEDSDHVLYGTTTDGTETPVGGFHGSVFKLNLDGSGYQGHGFGDFDIFQNPRGGLLEDSDHRLYGSFGASYNWGSLILPGGFFSLSKDLSYLETPTVLLRFGDADTKGTLPDGSLVEGADGWLYGTCLEAGSAGQGVVFTMQKDGMNYVTLHDFSGTDGGHPAGVTMTSDGTLYGTTDSGTGAAGYVFSLAPLHRRPTGIELSETNLADNLPEGSPVGALSTQDADAGDTFSYTLVSGAGDADNGSFSIDSDMLLTAAAVNGLIQSNYTIRVRSTDSSGLYVEKSFALNVAVDYPPTDILLSGTSVAENLPAGAVVGDLSTADADADARFSYALVSGVGDDDNAAFSINAGDNQHMDTLLTAAPFNCLTRSSYSIRVRSTGPGGLFVEKPFSIGVMPSAFSYSGSLHAFDGNNSIDGSQPLGVMEASDGWLYGTTEVGIGPSLGWFHGTIFKVKRDGSGYQRLHTFHETNDLEDGLYPKGTLVQGTNGALYGVTSFGGTGVNYYDYYFYNVGGGTLFTLLPDGSGYRVLYNFGSTAADGAQPHGKVMLGSDGVLYGTTSRGGGNGSGSGAVFRIQTDGSGYRVLHSFGHLGDGDGERPEAGLMEGSDGALYGTTCYGGTWNDGTVFKIQKDGTGYARLYQFKGWANGWTNDDAFHPATELIEGGDGGLYGLTLDSNDPEWGSADLGSVFKIQKDGSGYCILHSFAGSGDGWNLWDPLARGKDGLLYGVTRRGGTMNKGTVFALREDGSGYRRLCNFPILSGGGIYPQGGLILASDGAFYGVTGWGGPMSANNGGGTVFKVEPNGPSFNQVACRWIAGKPALRFAGVPGHTYLIQRSESLVSTNWVTLKAVVAADNGLIDVQDANPPLTQSFYRTAQP